MVKLPEVLVQEEVPVEVMAKVVVEIVPASPPSPKVKTPLASSVPATVKAAEVVTVVAVKAIVPSVAFEIVSEF